jgi:hypothetical protein
MKTLRCFSSLFFFLCFCLSQTNAQWLQLGHQLKSQHIYAMTVAPNGTNGTNVFAASSGGGVFLSTNNGTSWSLAGLKNVDVVSLAVSGPHVFAGTNGSGIFISDDMGATWRQPDDSKMISHVFGFAVAPASAGNAVVYAGAYGGGVYRSTDYGSSWVCTSNEKSPAEIWCLALRDAILYAGTLEGTYFSSNDGADWKEAKGASDIHALAVCPARDGGADLFAGSIIGTGVWKSGKDRWERISSGLKNLYVWSLGISTDSSGKSILFAGTEGGIYYSLSNGKKWTPATGRLANLNIRSIAVSDKYVFVGTWGDGVWRRLLSDFRPARGPLH